MKCTDKMEHILQAQDGIVSTSDALQQDISKPVFLNYVRKNRLAKVAHGIYASEEAWPDIFRQLQMQYPSIIVSHESALYLHGLAEREPDPVPITVRQHYHSSSMKNYALRLHYVSPEKLELGLSTKESPTGYPLRCYNLERTLCDLLRNRRVVDYQELINAFKSYSKYKEKNIPLLMRYGEIFHVAKKLKTYLEVLL